MTWIHQRLAKRLRSEEGWVLVTAMVVMAIMLGVGLAALANTDTQTGQSRQERARESAFNLAEGLLQAESVVLQSNWPTGAPCTGNAVGCGYVDCNQTNASSNLNQCPNPSQLVGTSGAFSNVDQTLPTGNNGVQWSLQVRDDLGVSLQSPPSGYTAFYPQGQIPTYFNRSCATGSTCWPTPGSTVAPGDDKPVCTNNTVVCTWDNNGNNQLWVRVDATAGGKTRSLVALLHLENFPVNLSSKVSVSGGAVNFGNSGNKSIVDSTGSPDGVVVRCYPTTSASTDGFPNTGNPISTTLATAVTSTNTASTITVVPPSPGGMANFQAGMVIAVGVGTGKQTPVPYELVTIKSGGVDAINNRLTFTTKLQNPHAAGEKVELAPSPTTVQNPNKNNCESWISPNEPGNNGADKHQLDPYAFYTSDPTYPNFMDDTTFAEVTQNLPGLSTCPTNWNTNIYIASAPAGGCTLPGGTINSQAHPHFIIVGGQAGGCSAGPALTLGSSTVFWGVIYLRDYNCLPGQLVMKVTAGGQVGGGIVVDGHGQVSIGNASNSNNCAVQGGTPSNPTCPTVKYFGLAFQNIAASGAAGLVQNTWRELAPGQ